jgi:hypothetical protein
MNDAVTFSITLVWLAALVGAVRVYLLPRRAPRTHGELRSCDVAHAIRLHRRGK